MKTSAQSLYELKAGHPALDFVNTLDDRFAAAGPSERIATYRDLLRFSMQAGLLPAVQAQLLERFGDSAAAQRALQSARSLREALARVLYGLLEGREPDASALAQLERHFKVAQRHRTLQAADAATLAWTWSAAAGRAALPVWLLAERAAELLLAPTLRQLRACEADTCRWLFLDTSKSHTRRWCDMKVCGNRMKARRFQARHG